jgi:hypothetical protein
MPGSDTTASENTVTARTLTDIANSFGTDKGTLGPSARWIGHNYTDIYAAYLECRRDTQMNILEIGLGVLGEHWDSRIVHGRNTGGASLKMWQEYLPHANIFGIDVNACPYLDNERTKTFVADQGNVQQLEAFTNATERVLFDVIIDDGSHRPDHQQVSLGYFFRWLKSGGVYFIEDLSSNGLGDEEAGRHACDKVINTRRILKHFSTERAFPAPNAIGDSAYLAANIHSLAFHSPEVEISQGQSIQYKPDSELLCAIRKK